MSDGEQAATPPADAPPAAQPVEKTFTAADVEKIVKERLERAQRKAEQQADEARKQAEEKALQEQGEYKTLADTRAARIAELEAESGKVSDLTKRAERYEAALKKQLEATRADLPFHIVALLDKLDPADQLEWIAQNREQLRKGDGVGSPQPGTRQQPKVELPAPRATI